MVISTSEMLASQEKLAALYHEVNAVRVQAEDMADARQRAGKEGGSDILELIARLATALCTIIGKPPDA